MTNLKASLKKLIGRAKRNMATILMGLVGIFLPIGAAFFIIGLEKEGLRDSVIFMVMGAFFWGLGIFAWRELKKVYEQEENEQNYKYLLQLQELKGIREDIKDSIGELTNEIRLDREERKQQGEVNDKPK